MDVLSLAIAGIIGCFAGGLAGVFGVGGGFLLVPALNLFIGIPIELAVGASTCQVLGPATTSLLARRFAARDLRLPAILSGGLVAGVMLGGMLLRNLRESGSCEVLGRTVGCADLVVLVGYLSLVCLLLMTVLWEFVDGTPKKFRANGPLGQIRLPPMIEFNDSKSLVSLSVFSWYGVGIGFASGLLGMSGGLILFPSLLYLWSVPVQTAIRMSLVIVWGISFLGTIVHSWNGYVCLDLVAALLIGGTMGARAGAHLSLRAGGRTLRKGFAVLLVLTAVMVSIRLIQLFSVNG